MCYIRVCISISGSLDLQFRKHSKFNAEWLKLTLSSMSHFPNELCHIQQRVLWVKRAKTKAKIKRKPVYHFWFAHFSVFCLNCWLSSLAETTGAVLVAMQLLWFNLFLHDLGQWHRLNLTLLNMLTWSQALRGFHAILRVLWFYASTCFLASRISALISEGQS